MAAGIFCGRNKLAALAEAWLLNGCLWLLSSAGSVSGDKTLLILPGTF
jgi:hypothetical protein